MTARKSNQGEDRLKSVDQFVKSASVFQRPSDLLKLLESHRMEWTVGELMNNPKLKPFKEAWQAGMFGLGYEHLTDSRVQVRICEPAQFPDFEMKGHDGTAHQFESTIATLKRLGEVYRGDARRGPILQ